MCTDVYILAHVHMHTTYLVNFKKLSHQQLKWTNLPNNLLTNFRENWALF